MKYEVHIITVGQDWSLSSWRAWIEMCKISPALHECRGRSPHGERGLKYVGKLHGLLIAQVALLMESVD